MKRHLSYDPFQVPRTPAIFYRGKYTRTNVLTNICIRASASIMRRLVEDVTGKKIEHLIKKGLPRPGLALRRNVQLVQGGSQEPRVAYPCRIPRGYFRKSAANYVNTCQISNAIGYNHRRIVNSMLYARACSPR